MKRRIANNKNIQTMEQKDIDIYEILKDEEYGTELYTPICGRVWHSGMANDKDSAKAIWTEDEDGREHFFDKNGKVSKEGEVLLFPSKEMRDWSKFFKKGDVLEYKKENNQATCLFDSYEDDKTKLRFTGLYTLTKGKIWDTPTSWDIHDWVKSDHPAEYIKTIEERLGGKLNLETLEIEKSEFKDGDVLFVKCNDFAFIEIFEYSKKNGDLCDHASLDITNQILDISGKYIIREDHITELRLATEEEKKQFFSALAKKGKAWDAEKKQVVDLKPVKLTFEIGKLYVFNEDDEDGELTIIGKLIDKNESEDTLTFGNQYEIENEKFVTDQAFDLRISVNKELREATENEVELFNKHYAIWKKEKEAKEHRAFKPFDKVLVRSGDNCKWLPALFIRDRGVGFESRHTALPIHSGEPASFAQCISYDGNEYLAFTSDPF